MAAMAATASPENPHLDTLVFHVYNPAARVISEAINVGIPHVIADFEIPHWMSNAK